MVEQIIGMQTYDQIVGHDPIDLTKCKAIRLICALLPHVTDLSNNSGEKHTIVEKTQTQFD